MHIYGSYRKIKTGVPFFGTPGIVHRAVKMGSVFRASVDRLMVTSFLYDSRFTESIPAFPGDNCSPYPYQWVPMLRWTYCLCTVGQVVHTLPGGEQVRGVTLLGDEVYVMRWKVKVQLLRFFIFRTT